MFYSIILIKASIEITTDVHLYEYGKALFPFYPASSNDNFLQNDSVIMPLG